MDATPMKYGERGVSSEPEREAIHPSLALGLGKQARLGPFPIVLSATDPYTDREMVTRKLRTNY